MSNYARTEEEGRRAGVTTRARGMDPADRAFVTAQRHKGVSWSNIAKMLGGSELDIRGACDPTMPPVVASAAPPPEWKPRSDRDHILVRLEAGPARCGQISDATRIMSAVVTMALQALKRDGRVELQSGFWSLTPRGVKELATNRGAVK